MGLLQVANRPLYRPTYSAGGGGSLVDGNNATISLTGQGTKSATVVSLKDHIEGASAGTALYGITALSSSGWANCNGTEAGSGQRRTQVSTALPLYGTKSLECKSDASTSYDGRFGVSWDTGAAITDIFLRDYVRINHASTGGQWKMLRLAAEDCLTDDSLTNCYASNQNGYSFDFFHTQKGNGCGAAGATQVWGDPGTDYNTTFGDWYEREIRIKPSTAAAATDGVFEARFRRVSDWVRVCNINHTGIEFYDTGEVNRNRRFILQNYINNGAFDSNATTVYMDGGQISNGDQVRVYLSTGTSWATINGTNGVQRELQDIVSYGATTTIKVRKGALSTLTGVRAFVVLADGSVLDDAGHTVTPA
jgi:hypothetical protein